MIKLRLGLVLMCFIAMGSGCASNHKTMTTEKTVEHHGTEVTDAADEPDYMVVEKSSTTTTSTETKPTQTGIIGGFFKVIGTIIAFPFKVIGNLLQAIF